MTSRPLRASLEDSLQGPRIAAGLAAALGILALALAAVGIAGVFAYVVTERTREIGIRRAIGATRASVIRLICVRAGWPLVTGVVLGSAASLVMTPLLGAFLVGVEPRDPRVIVVIVAVLTAVATVAVLIPVRRALRIDPAITLKAE